MEHAGRPEAGHLHVLLPRASVHARRLPGRSAIAPALDELLIADPPSRWRDLGFDVDEGGWCGVGAVGLQLGAGGDEGIVGWALRDVAGGAIDGLATIASGAPERGPEDGGAHPNGAIGVDHVVVATPDLSRTCDALQAAGFELRRVREAGRGARQAFFLLGPAILEVVGPAEPDGDGPAAFWGLVVVVSDLDAACARLGELVGAPRDAVQEGRRIASVRREAGLGTALAFMSPR